MLTLTVSNSPLECALRIVCAPTGASISGITKLRIKRRVGGDAIWSTLYEKNISSQSDLAIEALDINTKSHFKYYYMALPVAGGIEQLGASASATCEFDGIFVGDITAQYVCRINPKYVPPEPNAKMALIEPMGRKYPFVVQNGISDYLTGSVSGWFAPTPPSGQYDLEFLNSRAMREYRDALFRFLKNGRSKVIKTYDGHGWYGAIRPNPKEVQSDYIGGADITFDWVEVGDFPQTGMVIL